MISNRTHGFGSRKAYRLAGCSAAVVAALSLAAARPAAAGALEFATIDDRPNGGWSQRIGPEITVGTALQGSDAARVTVGAQFSSLDTSTVEIEFRFQRPDGSIAKTFGPYTVQGGYPYVTFTTPELLAGADAIQFSQDWDGSWFLLIATDMFVNLDANGPWNLLLQVNDTKATLPFQVSGHS